MPVPEKTADRPTPSRLPATPRRRLLRLLELLGLFVCIPALLSFLPALPVMPILWIVAAGCGYLLCKDPAFDRASLWRASAAAHWRKALALHLAVGFSVFYSLTACWYPELLFSLVKQHPLLWLTFLLLYPLLSVYPQELIYRTFFFHRYQSFFPGRWLSIPVNALLFGYMHIIFRNGVAVGLTIAGGILFAVIYERSRSTLWVSVVHSLYGGLLFTLGLGRFFSRGTLATITMAMGF